MILDKNGKLFGKINIIDLLLIVVVVAIIGIFGYKFLAPQNAGTTQSGTKAIMRFYAEEISDFVLDDTIHPGDVVYDVQEKVVMGTVTDFDTFDSVVYNTDAQGNVVKTTKEDYKSVTVTAEVTGEEFANGIIIDGTKYIVGHSMTLAAGKAKMYLRVSDIEFVK